MIALTSSSDGGTIVVVDDRSRKPRTAPPGALRPVDHIVMGIERLSAAARSQAWGDAGEWKLTPTQRNIVLLLAEAKAGMRLSELAQRLVVSLPTVSDAVNTLAGKGLVSKARAKGDARALALVLTGEGKSEAQRVAGGGRTLHAAVEQLPVHKQEALLEALVTMIGSLQEDGAIPVTKTCVSCSFFRANVHPRTGRPHHCAYVDAPLGLLELRVHCPEHDLVPVEDLQFALRKLRAG